MNNLGNDHQQNVTFQFQRADRIIIDEWDDQNTSRALEMYHSGELADFVIEVHQVQQQHDQNDGDKGLQKGNSSIGGHVNTAAAIQKAEFNVHKFILSVNSDVFRAMFSHKDAKECRESRIIITDSTILAVHQMIYFMYTGAIPYPNDWDDRDNMLVLPLMAIAHKYHIKPMMRFIDWILANNLTVENVFDRLGMAELYGIEKLKSACSQMISENMKELKQRPEWLEMQENSPELALYLQQAEREYEERKNEANEWEKAGSGGWGWWPEEETGSGGWP